MAGHFDICKEMALRNMDIRISPLENIEGMQLTHKGKDTKITIGFSGDELNGIFRNEFVGGLLLCNRKQYFEIKKELEGRDPVTVTHTEQSSD